MSGAGSLTIITFVWTAGIAPGKTSSAMKFAHEISAYMHTTFGVDIDVLRPIGGNPQCVAWSVQYQDLAALDSISQKSFADKHYWELVNKARDNFMAGSMRDSIWQSM